MTHKSDAWIAAIEELNPSLLEGSRDPQERILAGCGVATLKKDDRVRADPGCRRKLSLSNLQ